MRLQVRVCGVGVFRLNSWWHDGHDERGMHVPSMHHLVHQTVTCSAKSSTLICTTGTCC